VTWKIAAAGTFPDSKTLFFLEGGVNGRYAQWDPTAWQRDLGFPRSVASRFPGLPVGPPDAVLVAPFPGERRTSCFFYGDECVEVHNATGRAASNFPRKIQKHFPGLWPSGIDAVLYAGPEDYVFFRRGEYAVVGADRKVKPGYPRKLSTWKGMFSGGVDAATWVTRAGVASAFVFKGDECIHIDLPSRECKERKPIRTAFKGLLPLKSSRTRFEPELHGFKFVNSFDVDARMFGRQTWNMGLCGGMAFGALDRFQHRRSVPPDTKPPGEKCPELELRFELIKRQLATLVPGLIEVLAFQALPDQDQVTPPHPELGGGGGPAGFGTHLVPGSRSAGVETITQKSWWPRIKKLLDASRPAIVCLIRVKGAADPSKNHQVLAVGYDQMERNLVRLNVYDPNHPGEEQVIVFNPVVGERLKATQDDGSPVRAFFLINEPPSMY